jgi:Flp pilus assembly pilin Flp
MLNLYVKAMNFLKDECGQDSVEYAILIGIIATGVVTSVGTIATYVQGQFSTLAGAL